MPTPTPDATLTEFPDLPTPERFANYKGNRARMLRGIYGPTEFGSELMCAVSVHYDPIAGSSRVGFAFATIPMIQAAFLADGTTEIAPSARRAAALAIAKATKAAA